ncbi:MAG: hypothetical protein ACR2IA_13535 [Pyrinomonadaceae bacterium]
MKARKGYVFQVKNGIWYARFTYTDNGGKRRNVKRRANIKSHGEEILKELKNGVSQAIKRQAVLWKTATLEKGHGRIEYREYEFYDSLEMDKADRLRIASVGVDFERADLIFQYT